MKSVLNALSVLAVCSLILGVSYVDATKYVPFKCRYKLTEKGQWVDFRLYDTHTEFGATQQCRAELKEEKPSIEPHEIEIVHISPKAGLKL